jgi:hypothetical protein
MKQKKLIGGAMKYEGATLSSSQRLNNCYEINNIFVRITPHYQVFSHFFDDHNKQRHFERYFYF